MSAQADPHVYDRSVVSGADDAPGRIVARIRPDARVLDVGTGSGALGRCLKEEKRCIVDGLTVNAAEQAAAQPHYRRVALTDLEREPASRAFAGEAYDYIVCADVLEHLRNADAVLADLGRLLTPDGRILVSVPNVAYMGVLASLVAGHLCRTREGLLDSTHVRFFDRRGIDELAAAAGMTVLAVERVVRNPGETEFRHADFEAFPPAVAEYLRMLPDALTYEYVVEMAPAAAAAVTVSAADCPAYAEVGATPYFEAQAFFDGGSGFLEQHSARAFGRLGEDRIRLHFPIPADVGTALHGLIVDFADRPGVFELFCVRIEDAVGASLWQWSGDWSGHLVFRDLESLPVRGVRGGRLMRGTGCQPRMQTGFAPPLPAAAGLVVEMTAPQRYESVAFEQANRNVAEELRTLRGFLQTSVEENHALHRLLQSFSEEKHALIRAQKTAEDLIEEIRREHQRQHERVVQLESVVAAPFRLAVARVRWVLQHLQRIRRKGYTGRNGS